MRQGKQEDKTKTKQGGDKMINPDKVKSAIGEEVFRAINSCNLAQLEKWYRDCIGEHDRESSGTERKYKLYMEKEYLLYRINQ